MKARIVVPIVLAAAIAGGLTALTILPAADQTSASHSFPILADYAFASTFNATARSAVIEGRTVGEVQINGQTAIRIRTSAGGLTPYQRAQTVANRLNQLPPEITVHHFRTRMVNGQVALMANDHLIVTADQQHATLNQTSRLGLASQWRTNIASAMGVVPPTVAETPATPPAVGGVAEGPLLYERQAQKVVPILSVGTGLRVGVALVTGPSAQVAQVNAVAQLEGDFRGTARVRAFVPIDVEGVTDLSRVPRTSVAGIADLRL